MSDQVTLTGLFVYPVKSARGIELTSATLSDRGLVHDRRFMVVDEAGRFLTQRTLARLTQLGTAIQDDALVLTIEGQTRAVPLRPTHGVVRRVKVFHDELDALDLGDELAHFLSAALGCRCSLVYQPDDTRRQVDPKHASERDIVGFADGFPYLLTNESSLAALNSELARGGAARFGRELEPSLARGTARSDTPVTMQRFRPNFVIAGVPAFSEDHLRDLTIGGLPFVALKPCSRCVIVNTDPATGKREKGVLETLLRVHEIDNRPMFGQNLVARGAGQLHVGDPVDVAPRF